MLGKSCIVFLCCSQDLPTFIKYLLSVFHALSFQDCKNQNIQKTETLEQGVMVHGIPVHRRLEQEDCKFEASLKKSLYYFLEKILFYMLHGFLLHMCSCPREGSHGAWITGSVTHQMRMLGTERAASTPIAEPSRLLYRALITKFLTRISELQSACTCYRVYLLTFVKVVFPFSKHLAGWRDSIRCSWKDPCVSSQPFIAPVPGDTMPSWLVKPGSF